MHSAAAATSAHTSPWPPQVVPLLPPRHATHPTHLLQPPLRAWQRAHQLPCARYVPHAHHAVPPAGQQQQRALAVASPGAPLLRAVAAFLGAASRHRGRAGPGGRGGGGGRAEASLAPPVAAVAGTAACNAGAVAEAVLGTGWVGAQPQQALDAGLVPLGPAAKKEGIRTRTGISTP